MHRPTLAGRRRRTRRALLAAALPVAFAAAALPSAADAAEVFGSEGFFFVQDRSMIVGGAAETNEVTVREERRTTDNVLVVTDAAGVTASQACVRVSPTVAECPVTSNAQVGVSLAGGDDRMEYRTRHRGSVELGAGADILHAGTREPAFGFKEPVTYSGGPGQDLIDYGKTDRGVRLTPEDGLANDGRSTDKENVSPDFESIFGSEFADVPLFGTSNPDFIFGRGGSDQIAGGGGDDTFLSADLDGADDYHGGPDTDMINYGPRPQDLIVDLDNVADDGQSGERDNVRLNVENVRGGTGDDTIDSLGAFSVLDGRDGDDTLLGGIGPDTLLGGMGDDSLDGGFGDDVFPMGATADGADTVRGSSGLDTVDYRLRTRPINATLNFDGADDGEAGEGDELVGSNEQILGGSAGDTFSAPVGSRAAHHLFGFGGRDTLFGANGPDTIEGGGAVDTIAAFGGDDTVLARDGVSDIVGCGSSLNDTAELDSDDVDEGCEDTSVGVLRLTPKTAKVKAGERVHVRLSWRHPRDWRKLRKLELRLTRGGAPVGEVTIRPRRERIGADGAIELVRKRTRLAHKGKTVTARLALRLDDRLAGQTLTAEVEATDRRGARQLERNAGTVRVTR
jgi:RTX calcium-binding nonapeptide repeat (4 copies)